MTDTVLLFSTRAVRLFAYGSLSVVLVVYLTALHLDEHRIGVLLTLTLIGDVILSLYLTTHADRIGRRRTLVAGALLMIAAGVVFASTRNFWWLLLAATIGVVSPSGNEVGPFLAVEQVALADSAPSRDRTSLFAWYNLTGSFATAIGALVSGAFTTLLMRNGFSALASYRSAIIGYGVLGVLMAILFAMLRDSPWRTGAPPVPLGERRTGEAPVLHGSYRVIARLSALFAVDSFAGGLVVQSLVAYWFYRRFGVSPAIIGAIFFGANLLAGICALAAARIAKRIGLLKTMVFTHLPSNILLLLVPLMPRLDLAI